MPLERANRSMPEDRAGRRRWHRCTRSAGKHLAVLGGELGIFQHARRSEPDPAHGYCVDDVARALEVDLLHARTLGWAAVAESARRNMQFLEDAFDEPSGRFLNFRTVDGDWIGGPGSNDSLGRAMLALGETIAAGPDDGLSSGRWRSSRAHSRQPAR